MFICQKNLLFIIYYLFIFLPLCGPRPHRRGQSKNIYYYLSLNNVYYYLSLKNIYYLFVKKIYYLFVKKIYYLLFICQKDLLFIYL